MLTKILSKSKAGLDAGKGNIWINLRYAVEFGQKMPVEISVENVDNSLHLKWPRFLCKPDPQGTARTAPGENMRKSGENRLAGKENFAKKGRKKPRKFAIVTMQIQSVIALRPIKSVDLTGALC